MENLSSWLPYASSFATQMLVAWLGYVVVVARHKKQTMWQEKYNAYRELLDAIQNMEHWASETYSSCHCLPTIGDSDSKVGQSYVAARRRVSQYNISAALVISDDVSTKVHGLNRDLSQEDFRFEENSFEEREYPEEQAQHAEKIQAIIRDYLGDIVALAKKDLR